MSDTAHTVEDWTKGRAELNPVRDVNGMTAQVGAKLCKELIGLMLA